MIRRLLGWIGGSIPPLVKGRITGSIALKYYQAGLGDTLLVAAVAREIRQRFPAIRIEVNGACPELLRNNPNIDDISQRWRGTELNYHLSPHNAGDHLERNLIETMCRKVGIRNPQHRPDIHLSDEERSQARAVFAQLPRPVITIQTAPGPYGGRRRVWPAEYWARFTALARGHDWTVVQLGEPSEPPIPGVFIPPGPVSPRQAVALVAEADLHVGIVSFLMHGAAAVGTYSVIVFGGFERYHIHGYPTMTPVESRIGCAPCARRWTRMTPCPIGNRCMRDITPESVFNIAAKVMARRCVSGKDVS